MTNQSIDLRDYFAAAALPAAMRVWEDSRPKEGETWDQMVARNSYELADAMLKARDQ